MYFWNIEQLTSDIKNNRLSEQDRFIYAFISIVLSAIGMEAVAFIPIEDSNFWDGVRSLGNIVIVTIGTWLAYQANAGKAGSDFLGRYFSIGFVLAVRFLALLLPLALLYFGYCIYAYPAGETIVSAPLDVLPYLLWYAALYWRVCKHIAAVNRT